MGNRVLATYRTAIEPAVYVVRQSGLIQRKAFKPVADPREHSLSKALNDKKISYAYELGPNFFSLYPQVAWAIERLAKSTAGVRGLLFDVSKEIELLDRATHLTRRERQVVLTELLIRACAGTNPEFSPELNLAVISLLSQSYAAYVATTFPQEQQGAFVGHDGRFFLDQYADLCTRILSGNEVRVVRDHSGRITATPTNSFVTWQLGLATGIQFTASHNKPADGGQKSNNQFGGVDTDVESEKISEWMKYFYNEGRGNGWLLVGPAGSDLVTEVDARQLYWDGYLSRLLSPSDVEQVRTAIKSGARFLVDGIFGALGPDFAYFIERLFPERADRRGVVIINEKPNPFIGGIWRPDPSIPQTLEESGALEVLAGDQNILFSVSGDKDADRTGPAVIIPQADVPKAKKYGLSVTALSSGKEVVNIVRFTPQQIFALLSFDRIVSHFENLVGTRNINTILEAIDTGKVNTENLYLLTSLPTSRLLFALAKRFKVKIILTSVGFKYLGHVAKHLEDTLPQKPTIISLSEESGGSIFGLLEGKTDPKGSVIQKDKSTAAIALGLMAAASRARLEGKNLLDVYVSMAEKLGRLFYYERLDSYYPNQAAAESTEPAAKVEADRIKGEVVEKVFDLEEPDKITVLAGLFGYSPERITGTRAHILDDVFLLVKEDGVWQMVNPEAQVTTFNDGVSMEVFHAGAKGKEGPMVTFYDKEGNLSFWWCFRTSGTESLTRLYVETAEPTDNPNPSRLIMLAEPIIRYAGIDRYGKKAGGPDYFEDFKDTITSKYA